MLTVEHDWVATDPPRLLATVCRNCGVVCDPRAGGFFDAAGDRLPELPPCPLVPPSDHTPGPWRAAPEWIEVHDDLIPIVVASASAERVGYALNADDARLIARAPAMRDALEAVLLFYAAPRWDDEARARWLALTGSTEATTRVLAGTVRRALR
jgi:hypothetical protein